MTTKPVLMLTFLIGAFHLSCGSNGVEGLGDSGSGYEDAGDVSNHDSDSMDLDSDGFTIAQGDCDDGEAFINPNAIEDLGNDGAGDQQDNDCDGSTDEKDNNCDCATIGVPKSKIEFSLAQAINLCDTRFARGVSKSFPGRGAARDAYATMETLGNNSCLYAQEGCKMAAISTGPIVQESSTSPDPHSTVPLNADGQLTDDDPQPAFQADSPTTAPKQEVCDVTQLVIQLTAPSNAKGFSFDFLFASAEYDEFIGNAYNDTFYAIMESPRLNEGKPTNIAFDDFGFEIEVDGDFFENPQHECDESGSVWGQEISQQAGSTGWLRTSWDVEPGEKFVLTFSIHDERDCSVDSIALIDNFTWHTEPVKRRTDPV